VLIPRIIHRIWLGSDEMPEEYVRFGESWREHHPGWEMWTWTDSNLPPLTYPGALERCRNFGEASDVLRYEALYRYGGIYVDTDVECRRSLEPLIEDVSAFGAWQRPGVIGSAVVGSIAEHSAIAEVLREVSEGAGSGPQVEATGPVALTRVLEKARDVKLFGPETFFPYDYWEIPLDPEVDAAEGAPDAYAIHHWHATWVTREDLMRRTRRLMARVQDAGRRNEQLTERNRELRRAKQQLRRELRKRGRRLRAVRGRERDLRRELKRVKTSRWWRLGRRLNAIRRPLGRRSARRGDDG
jgi:inositol phosphorylceramide mannosyltransferase catalytic subunit